MMKKSDEVESVDKIQDTFLRYVAWLRNGNVAVSQTEYWGSINSAAVLKMVKKKHLIKTIVIKYNALLLQYTVGPDLIKI